MNINQSAVVTVNTRDSRPQQEIATYTKSGELIKLTPHQALLNFSNK